MSFKWKTSLLITALTTLILLLGSAFFYLRFERVALKNELQQVKAHVTQMADDIRKNPRAVANWASDIDQYEYVVVRDGNGNVVFEKSLHFDSDWAQQMPPSVKNIDEARYTVNGQQILVASRKVKGASGLQVSLYENTLKIDKVVRGAGRLLLFGTLGGIVLAAFGSYLVASLTIRPVGSLIRRAGDIDVRDLSRRLPLPASKDELYALTVTFNGLLERIEDGFERQRRFIADASHELRTPLSVIAGHAAMLKRWGKQSEEVLSESIDYIVQESERLRLLTEQLLQNATLEQSSGATEPTDWLPVIREACSQLAFLHPAKALSLDLPNEPVYIAAPPHELKQTVLNLLDNAMKYTPENGAVSLSLHDARGIAELTVSDNGIGIPGSELPHIFERFYRAEPSRNREKGGTGLGLSIVKSIVDKHGGEIRIESEPGRGTVVHVGFPLHGNVTGSS